MSKSPKNMKKLLPKRKPERKPSEEDFTVRKSKYNSTFDSFFNTVKLLFLNIWQIYYLSSYTSFPYFTKT